MSWRVEVPSMCVYLRMLATDIVEEISGYLQSEFRRSLGQGTLRKKQHDTARHDRASEREFVVVVVVTSTCMYSCTPAMIDVFP